MTGKARATVSRIRGRYLVGKAEPSRQPPPLPRLRPELGLHLAYVTVGRDWLVPLLWPVAEVFDGIAVIVYRIRLRLRRGVSSG